GYVLLRLREDKGFNASALAQSDHFPAEDPNIFPLPQCARSVILISMASRAPGQPLTTKVMQRSLHAALHGFAVNDGNSMHRFNCTVFCFIPRRTGTMQAGFWHQRPLHSIPKVLLITTQGQPSHLTCGRT
ncbi:MAG: hypothetical protein ACLU9S_07915, partial [Oscillospiraceae bacterium]